MEYILFLISCIIIIKASDILVDSASSLAIKLKVPKSLIALTIVAFGTCAPEVGISFSSILRHNYSMAIANVVGSCIVNILFIIGLASFLHPIKLRRATTKRELPLLVLITAVFSCVILDDMLVINKQNILSRSDGIVLLILFLIFILYLIGMARTNKKDEEENKAKYGTIKSISYLIFSIILIVFSSDLLVDNAVKIAENLSVSHKIITMLIVVIGTSLPELVMTIRASKKEEYELAIGNIVGTNIFNICIVLGLPVVLFGGIKVVDFNIIDMLTVMLSSIILYIFSKSERKISRIEGFSMLLIFIIYYIYVLFI
ncbi:MAG: calcium/sodium antiporter [Bacilli bacterium]|nr:calcium/sodium antiporter [Bacilli bacterium]